MPKIVIFLLMILLALTGWYIGYSQGTQNQLVFNAAATSSLYEKALLSSDQVRKKFLKDFLYKQRCFLSQKDEYKTISVRLHPIHKEVYGYYEFNIERLCASGNCKCEYPKNFNTNDL